MRILVSSEDRDIMFVIWYCYVACYLLISDDEKLVMA